MMMTRAERQSSFQSSSSDDLGGETGTCNLPRTGSSITEKELEIEKFVRSVPKIELHVHLDGAFDPHQMWSHLIDNPQLLQCFPVEKELPWAKPGEEPLPLRYVVLN